MELNETVQMMGSEDYKEQKKHMENYIRCLRIRAEIEGIDLGVSN